MAALIFVIAVLIFEIIIPVMLCEWLHEPVIS